MLITNKYNHLKTKIMKTSSVVQSTKFSETDVLTHQFVKAIYRLIDDKKLNTPYDFCGKYIQDISFFKQLENGEVSLPYCIYRELRGRYNLNSHFFLSPHESSANFYLNDKKL